MKKEKTQLKNKLIYNNYQFYENPALSSHIDMQAAKGYSLCGAIGQFLDILIFRYTKNEGAKSYTIFRNHYDEELDKYIDEKPCNEKNEDYKIVCQNALFTVFGIHFGAIDEKTEIMQQKQNTLLSVSLKKSIIFISILLLLSAIGLVLKFSLIEEGDLSFNFLAFTLYFALIINFLFYFIGDLHDVVKDVGTVTNGKIYFDSRTKFKNIMFHIGDTLKCIILLTSIISSIIICFNRGNTVMFIDVFKMWMIFCIAGYMSRIRYQRSYISILLVEVALVTFTLL